MKTKNTIQAEEILKYVSFIFTIVAVGYFGVVEKTNSMIWGGIFGLALYLISNLDKLENFSISPTAGLKAELRKTIVEAYATIESLRELATELSIPILTYLAIEGNIFRHLRRGYKIDLANNITENLKKIGIKDEDITEIRSFFDSKHVYDHMQKIIIYTKNAENIPSEIKRKVEFYEEIDNLQETYELTGNKIELLLGDDVLAEHEELRELILDFDHYVKQKTFRRPEIWDKINKED